MKTDLKPFGRNYGIVIGSTTHSFAFVRSRSLGLNLNNLGSCRSKAPVALVSKSEMKGDG